MDTLVEPDHPGYVHTDAPTNEPRADTDGGRHNVNAQADATNDAPVCRICLMGAEEAEELGRLIRPCLCRGTVGYVHVNCLNTWRKASAARKAFWQCDQCGYKYRFVRTRALGIAQSPLVVGCSTLMLFTILVFSASFVVSLFIPSTWIEGSSSTVARLVDDSVERGFSDSSWSYAYYSPTALTNSMWKVAYQTLNEVLDSFLLPSETDDSSSTSSYRYAAQPRAKREKRDSQRQSHVHTNHPISNGRSGPFKSTIGTSRVAATERVVRLNKQMLDDPDDTYDLPRRPNLLTRLLRRFLLGLSVVGALSIMRLGWTLHVPLQWARRRGRRGEQRDSSLYTLIVLGFILYGVAKAMYSTYKVTQVITTSLLKHAETAILEVGSDDAVPLNHSIGVRDIFARARTRAFWNGKWWECVRWLRGLKETVAAIWREWRQGVRWRDIAATLGALFFAVMGIGGGGWGGVWVWQF